MSDDDLWLKLDVLVCAVGPAHLPRTVAALRAAGHRVQVLTDGASMSTALATDLPDIVVADGRTDGSPASTAIAFLADRGIPVISPERVLMVLEREQEGALFALFVPGRLV